MQPKPYRGQLPNYQHWSMRNNVGLWIFNEGNGDLVNDLSGNRNHGTINGATWVPGKGGPALDFDGDDYVELPDIDIINPASGSISLWFKPDATDVSQHIFWAGVDVGDGWGGDSEFHISLRDTASGELEFFAYQGGQNFRINTTFTMVNSWHHVVTTWLSGGAANLYLDGGLVDSVGGISSIGQTSWAKIRIARPGADLRYFVGDVDNVLIYSRALSAAEVWQLYIDPYIMFEPELISLFAPVAAGTTYFATPSDSFILSEATTKSVQKEISDTITLSESTVKSIQKSIADSLTLSDTTAKSIQKVITDSLILSESTAKSIQKAIDDSITLSESIAKSVLLTKSDSITLSESTVKSIEKVIADNITASDAVAKSIQIAKADNITLSESVSTGLSGVRILLWHYTDIFLSLIRSAQRAYNQDGTGNVLSLTVYDYLYITETQLISTEETDPS